MQLDVLGLQRESALRGEARRGEEGHKREERGERSREEREEDSQLPAPSPANRAEGNGFKSFPLDIPGNIKVFE